MCSVKCAVRSVQCSVYSVQCAVCSVQCLSNDVIVGSCRWDHQGGNYGDSGGEKRTEDKGKNRVLVDTGDEQAVGNSLLLVDTGEARGCFTDGVVIHKNA